MTGIIVLVLFLAGLVAMGVAVVLEQTPDTRDPEWAVGRLLAPGRAPDA